MQYGEWKWGITMQWWRNLFVAPEGLKFKQWLVRQFAMYGRIMDLVAWTEEEVAEKWEHARGCRELIAWGFGLMGSLGGLHRRHRRTLYRMFADTDVLPFPPWDVRFLVRLATGSKCTLS